MVAKAKKKVMRAAGKKPVRAAPVALADRWTAARREAFLTALMETANVMAAARAVGAPESSPYKLRAKDAAFGAAWDAALDQAYAKLELMLLRRATYGEQCDGEATPTISSSFALGLLRHHKTRERRGAPDLPLAMRGNNLRNRLEATIAEMTRDYDAQ